jgi:hypothetical protein
MMKETFKSMVRRILNEEVEKRNYPKERVPEMNGNGVNKNGKDKDSTKTFATDPNSRDRKSKEQLLDDLQKFVKNINDSILVVWDDHDDIMVRARDLAYLRISPNWEDNYRIECMIRNEDRLWFGGLTWAQVKDLVKEKLENLTTNPTSVEKAYDKSYRNRKDETPGPDKGLPQKDKPKTISTDKPASTSKNKEKDYSEEQVKKDDDLPNKPLKEVEKFEKQIDHKVKDPVKLRKRKPDTKLVVKL